jgi:hypothetical protein
MTLIIGMSKAEGIYLSADFRVTECRSGDLLDDAAVKMLRVDYPPPDTGTRALLAFSGLAEAPDRSPMGTWLRETLRGQAEYPNQSMAHLRSRLNRDIGPRGYGLIVNAIFIEGECGERRVWGGLSNLTESSPEPQKEFGYVLHELSEPFVFANGSGATKVFAGHHIALLERQLKVRPRRAIDHMKLLAAVNRRVAAEDKLVSPACHVAFLPARRPRGGESDDRFPPTGHTFHERGEPAPVNIPLLLSGFDMTDIIRDGMERMRAHTEGSPPPPEMSTEEMNRRTRRRD